MIFCIFPQRKILPYIQNRKYYRTLHNNGSDRCDGKLKSHGNTKGQQITEAGKRNFKVFFLQMQDRELFDNIDQAADCGNCLRDNRSIGTAFHSHPDFYNKQNIQEHIDHCRNDQKIQRRF